MRMKRACSSPTAPKGRADLPDNHQTIYDLLDHLVLSRTDDAILVIGLVKLLDILWITRAIEEGTRTFMLTIHIAKERTKEETKGKAKARKAKIEEEEEHQLAILAITGTSIAHKDHRTRIINLHNHLTMMGYVCILTNPGTPKEIALNW